MMTWGKGKDPMWYSDGRPANEAARQEGDPPWLGKSREQFQREEKERDCQFIKDRVRAAEEKRRELALRRQPKPKKPGGTAKPEAIVSNPDGTLGFVLCECECGGGLVIKADGEVSCHFCGATWNASLQTAEGWFLELRSRNTVIFFPASVFEKVEACG